MTADLALGQDDLARAGQGVRGVGTREPIDVVVPARNEEPTVAAVVEACLGCRWARHVIVVDDGSTDATADKAAAAGAVVLRRPPGPGSKAAAMEAGVLASDAKSVLFVDADCVSLTSTHLDEICAPYVEGRVTMSMGMFDYGALNPLVLRLPPTTGERVLPRWVFEAVPPTRREGYKIEISINEVVAEARLPTAARTMRGVTHRTKRDKLGRVAGYRATGRMFLELVGLLRVVRWRTYWFYLRDLKIDAG